MKKSIDSKLTSSSAQQPWKTAAPLCIGLVVLVLVVFWPTLGAQFLNYDDNDYVYENPHITSGLTLAGIGWAFTHFHASNWHPLTTISHMLDCQLFGLNAWGHHLTNVLLHALAAVLLFLALRELTKNTSSTLSRPPLQFLGECDRRRAVRDSSAARRIGSLDRRT